MNFAEFLERYCLDARSFEEKNARSMALAYKKLALGKERQATRLFAYNHALNQSQKMWSNVVPKPQNSTTKQSTKPAVKTPPNPAQTANKGPWKVRVWSKNKVVKTLTVDSDKEAILRPKIDALGVSWDKATIHDPKTLKTLSKFYKGK